MAVREPSVLPSQQRHSIERDCQQSRISEDTAIQSDEISPACPMTSVRPPTPEYRVIFPTLPYDPFAHKFSILFIWSLLLLDAAVLPLALFYPLWWASSLDPSYVFVITTSVYGVFSGIEWIYRSWKLMNFEHLRPLEVTAPQNLTRHNQELCRTQWRSNPLHRIISWKKKYYWGFDAFHWSYSIGYLLALIELIIGSSPDQPIVRLCASSSSTFVLYSSIILCGPTLYNLIPRPSRPRIPFRISSRAPNTNTRLRPATYTILEDVIAVGTGTGRAWRMALHNRYKTSWRFRRLLKNMDLFWGIGGILIGIGTLTATSDERIEQSIAYGIGWGVPPLWAIIWTLSTYCWVRVELSKEMLEWEQRDEKGGSQT